MKNRLWASVLTLAVLAVRCGPSVDSLETVSALGAYSHRPQSYDRLMVTIRLSSPSLLEAASQDPISRRWTIPSDARLKIEEEQRLFEFEMSTLSKDIAVIHRYHYVLNGITIVAPRSLESILSQLPGVSWVERTQTLSLEEQTDHFSDGNLKPYDLGEFLGVPKLMKAIEEQKVQPKTVSRPLHIGIIDTGVDYTHRMFGGYGTPLAYSTQNPDTLGDGGFPNKVFAHGYDFVGSRFDASSVDFDDHIPRGDGDPLDEMGHGTHVAGILAQILQLSQNTGSYRLVPLKVFGHRGITNDAVMIAAFEYAIDPNQDGEIDDRLDVINVSLGTYFGSRYLLYHEALSNLLRTDVMVVAAAGNAGPVPYIVGAPSTHEHALSVAASLDSAPQQWQFRGVRFRFSSGLATLVEAVESSITRPIDDGRPVSSSLVAMGAVQNPAELRGKVAFVDRGGGPLQEKIKMAAEAQAVGIVVANHVPGDPVKMGGEGFYDIYAIMVSQEIGNQIKNAMKDGEVHIDFVVPQPIEKPYLIDTLASFSSRGPRSYDGYLKPEIAAPGQKIQSAHMGSGDQWTQKSGTSMAAPVVTGVFALAKQLFPLLTRGEIKSLLVSSAQPMKQPDGREYPLTFAGNGRVDAGRIACSALLLTPTTLSLGEHYLEEPLVLDRKILIKNLFPFDVTYELSLESKNPSNFSLRFTDAKGFSEDPFKERSRIFLKKGESLEVDLTMELSPKGAHEIPIEVEGAIYLTPHFQNFPSSSFSWCQEAFAQRIPIFGVIHEVSRLEFLVGGGEQSDNQGIKSRQLLVKNVGPHAAVMQLFNLIGFDEPKKNGLKESPQPCDLQAAGWRYGSGGQSLEFAFNTYGPISSWSQCEPIVLIDTDDDAQADFELIGAPLGSLGGKDMGQLKSYLLDAHAMRRMRHAYEQDVHRGAYPNYTSAILAHDVMTAERGSTVAITRMPQEVLGSLGISPLRVKILLQGDISFAESDDFLGDQASGWHTIDKGSRPDSAAIGLGDALVLPGQVVSRAKPQGGPSWLVLFPKNHWEKSFAIF